ncbi:hypothetical protein Emag_006091 [Eimeria magna]
MLSGGPLATRSLASLVRRAAIQEPPVAHPPNPQTFSLSKFPFTQQTFQPDTIPQNAQLHHLKWEGAPLGGPRGPLPPTLSLHPKFAAPVLTPECFSLYMKNAVGGRGAPPLPCVWGPLGAPHFLIPEVTEKIEEPPEASAWGPLLFRWRPRKSYKQRTMGLASTKSRRRWAARRR